MSQFNDDNLLKSSNIVFEQRSKSFTNESLVRHSQLKDVLASMEEFQKIVVNRSKLTEPRNSQEIVCLAELVNSLS